MKAIFMLRFSLEYIFSVRYPDMWSAWGGILYRRRKKECLQIVFILPEGVFNSNQSQI